MAHFYDADLKNGRVHLISRVQHNDFIIISVAGEGVFLQFSKLV